MVREVRGMGHIFNVGGKARVRKKGLLPEERGKSKA